jgi:tetratricopeptide (TPR) repeat protein
MRTSALRMNYFLVRPIRCLLRKSLLRLFKLMLSAAEKRYEEAIQWYSKAIDCEPSAVLYANRSFAHIKLEEYGAAIGDACEAIKLDGNYVKVCNVCLIGK